MSPLAADLSSLPKAKPTEIEGWPPDHDARFVGVLAELWHAQRDDDKPTAMGTRFRHSDAGKCAREIAYTAAGFPSSDPVDIPGSWAMALGTLLHEHWQAALAERFPDAEIEAKVQVDGFDGSGHLDAVIVADGKTVVYELKTVGGYAYKAALGKIRRGDKATGPKPEHVMQAALGGLARNADEIVIGYLAKDNISAAVGAGLPELTRVAAEWTLTRDEYEPIAIAERDRITAILNLVDRGELAARKFPPGTLPPGAEIVDPKTGRWHVTRDGQIEDMGTWWACGYCRHQTLCAGTEAGRIATTSVTL